MNNSNRPAMSEKMAEQPPLRPYVYWAIAGLFLLQVAAALALDSVRRSDEFSNDVRDYHNYIKNPHILWYDYRTTGIGGGFLTSPLLPYLIYGPCQFFAFLGSSLFGFEEQQQLFVGMRLTMILWFNIGLVFAWKVISKVVAENRERMTPWLASLIILMPVNFIAPAIMGQDDSVTFGWGGIALYCWRRWGIGVFVSMMVLGVFLVKPYLLFVFPAVWMAYPAWRVRSVILCGLTTAGLFGFFFWRDGSIEFFRYTMNGSLSPTLFSIVWLLQDPIDFTQWGEFGVTVSNVSKPFFVATMLVWCLSSWWKPYPLQAAISGTFIVFFLTLPAAMPEYEFWFLPWMMLVMWQAVQAKNWKLFAACWLHSTLSYAYKFFYACDKTHFKKSFPSPFENFYERHFNYDLRWVFIALAVGATVCRLTIVYYLWRDRYLPRAEKSVPEIPVRDGTA